MEQLEETWRLETKQLIDTVNSLQEENRRLRAEVRESTPSPSTNRLSPPRFTSNIGGDAIGGLSGMATSTASASLSSSTYSSAAAFSKLSLRDTAGSSRFEASSGTATAADASNSLAGTPNAASAAADGAAGGITACACPCSDCLQCSLGDEIAIVRKLKQIASQQRAEIRVLRRESIEKAIELEVVRSASRIDDSTVQ